MAKKYKEFAKLDLPTFEAAILAKWQQDETFEKSVSNRDGATSFVFYEGPPSANGLPGIHHVISRTLKDLVCRYKTMQGYQVQRKGGWDTHGLPIELGVEKELGITKEDIGTKITVEAYNAKCREAVLRYKDKWDDITQKMGYWVDLKNPYITYDNNYIESVWWLLSKMYNRGYLYESVSIQPYSPAAGTGLSSHELNQPGTYKDVKDTSATVLFKAPLPPKGGNEKHPTLEKIYAIIRGSEVPPLEGFREAVGLLAWTTTPWTLPSNLGLTVGAKIDYVLVKTFNPYTKELIYVILAEKLLSKYFKTENKKEQPEDVFLEEPKTEGSKIPPPKADGGAWCILGKFLGKDLEGIQYEQLLPCEANTIEKIREITPNAEPFKVVCGDFVTTEDGTGIVHTAPAFGADDFKVGKANNLGILTLVDRQGKFVEGVGEFSNRYVKNYKDEKDYIDVNVDIAVKLKLEGKAFKVEKYEHNYPHCWRTDKPILYYPLDAWFIKTTAVKEQMIAANKTINWKPESTGTGRFGNWLENLQDWNLSRSRFWGTPLPIWKTEDGEEQICIGSINELMIALQKSFDSGVAKVPPSEGFREALDLHKPFIDEVVLVSPTGKPMYRVPDLIDVWFDSGAMPYAQHHFPFENKELFAKNYPADFIAEGVDQTRGWFYTLHAIAALVKEDIEEELAPPPPKGGELQDPSKANAVTSKLNNKEDAVYDYQTADPMLYGKLKEFVKTQRSNPTQAERSLWEMLRGKKLENFKFRRQHIIGSYIADFVNLDYKLVIEVDGLIHQLPENKISDIKRTEWLQSKGYTVSRFNNEEVINNPEIVLQKIATTLNELKEKSASYQTPPLDEETNTLEPLAKEIITTLNEPTEKSASYQTPPLGGGGAGLAYKSVVSNGLVLDKNGIKMSKRLGNIIDPFVTIEKFGADATRWYLVTNASPWDNLKFDIEGIKEVQRKFFGTLYNTYQFFALYANVDGFDNTQPQVPIAQRPEIDRWILSSLHSLIQTVTTALNDYEPTVAGRAIDDFLDSHLSNWYVRLCRRRFWKSDLNEDKLSAYQTLYECLETLVKLIAPIAPFFADNLFNNLNEVTNTHKVNSVHLTNFPVSNDAAIDKALEERMALAQDACSLILSLRKNVVTTNGERGIKVRQPLQKVMIPVFSASMQEQLEKVADLIKAEVNVKEIEYLNPDNTLLRKKIKPNFIVLGKKMGTKMKAVSAALTAFTQQEISTFEKEETVDLVIENETVTLALGDVEISTEDVPGWAVASKGLLTTILDITITPQLLNEGNARELINRIQKIRKDSNLNLTDRINVQVTDIPTLTISLMDYYSYICGEILADKLVFIPEFKEGEEVEINDYQLFVNVKVNEN